VAWEAKKGKRVLFANLTGFPRTFADELQRSYQNEFGKNSALVNYFVWMTGSAKLVRDGLIALTPLFLLFLFFFFFFFSFFSFSHLSLSLSKEKNLQSRSTILWNWLWQTLWRLRGSARFLSMKLKIKRITSLLWSVGLCPPMRRTPRPSGKS